MRIYIIGPVASGKTTYAKKVAEEYNIPYYELDKLVHDDEKKLKRSEKEIKKLFKNIIKQKDWVIEDVGRDIFSEGRKMADIICYMKVTRLTTYYRIIKRWIVQRTTKEYDFKPTFKVLKEMFRWANKDLDHHVLKELKEYKDKLIIIK